MKAAHLNLPVIMQNIFGGIHVSIFNFLALNDKKVEKFA